MGRGGGAHAKVMGMCRPGCTLHHTASGNVLSCPWCVLQFGGMALMLGLATLRPVAPHQGACAVGAMVVDLQRRQRHWAG